MKKPFFKTNHKNSFDTRNELSTHDAWSAIMSLISFKIEKRPTQLISIGHSIYLVFMHIVIGMAYTLIIFVLLIGAKIDDQRTFMLFSIVYFIYGFFSSVFTEAFKTPFATFKFLNLIAVVLLLILVNFMASILGFDSIR